jgi:hypothetical protein
MNFTLKKVLILEKKDHPVKEFLKKDKIDFIVWEIYRELYQNSTPNADFDLLYMTAKRNGQNQKDINYMSYYISQEKFENIMDNVLKKYRLSKRNKNVVKASIYLGCSPTCSDKNLKK